MYKRLHDKARQKWFIRYELRLNEIAPFTTGRVCWDSASFYCDHGLDPKQAAEEHARTMWGIKV